MEAHHEDISSQMDTSRVQMALSAKGVEMLHIDGYLYHFADIGRYGYRWMCNKRKDKVYACKARLVTSLIDDDLTQHNVIVIAEKHTHERCTAAEISKVLQRRRLATERGKGSTLPRVDDYFIRHQRNHYDGNGSSSKHTIARRKFKKDMVYLLKTSYGSQMVAVNGFLYRLEGRVKTSGSLRWECIRSRDLRCSMHLYTNPTQSGRYKLHIANGENHNHEPYTPQKLNELLKKHNVSVISESQQLGAIKKVSEATEDTEAVKISIRKRLNATKIYVLSNNPLTALTPKNLKDTDKRKFTFLPSAKGNQVLCLENNIYHFDSIGPQTQRSYWTCILRRDKVYRCNGRVTTQMTSNGPIIVKVSGEHKHPDSTEEIKRRLRKSMMIPGEDFGVQFEEVGSNDAIIETNNATMTEDIEEGISQDQQPWIVKTEPQDMSSIYVDEDAGFLYVGDDPNELDFEILSDKSNISVEIIEEEEEEEEDFQAIRPLKAIEIEEVDYRALPKDMHNTSTSHAYGGESIEKKYELNELMDIITEDEQVQEVAVGSNSNAYLGEMIEEYLVDIGEETESNDEANLFAQVDANLITSDVTTTTTRTICEVEPKFGPIVLEDDQPDMNIKNISMLCSAKGGELLCVDGYIYHFKCVQINRVYWACIKCKDATFKCPSRITTRMLPDGSLEVVRVTNRHSHPVSYDDLHRRMFNSQKAKNIFKSKKKSYTTFHLSHSDDLQQVNEMPIIFKYENDAYDDDDDDDSPTMKLYAVSDGPPSLAVRMTLKALNITYELINVDYCAGEHMTEEYAQMNPQKEIPVLDDNGFFLAESIAIMQYLCEKYAPTTPLYPTDPALRALVNHRLCFNMSFYYSSISAYAMAPIFFDYPRDAMGLKKVNNSLSVFETYLKREGTKYAASNDLTIADFALVASTLCLEAIKYDFSPFPLVKKWYETFKQEYPQYWNIANGGMQEIAHFDLNPPDLSNLNHPFHPARKLKN